MDPLSPADEEGGGILAFTTAFAAVLACALDPGGRVGRHVQQACPELVIGLAGRGTATVAGRELPLIAGSVVELPLGDHLAIRNDSDEDALHYLIVKARPAR